jgi:hypothetical protein
MSIDYREDPFEVNGNESAERFARRFNQDWGGRIFWLDQCCVVSDAAGHLGNDLDHFAMLIGVPATSPEFEMALFIGNRYFELDGVPANPWVDLALLTIPTGAEFADLIEAGHAAKYDDFSAAIRSLIPLRRDRGQ